ncbi:hypothetical protein F5J12DRAFT_780725 [Pisolithus orientalis]|uniref:uncharacterized protein n=1 Tax=Pisolithus orientalis TaxID=936130 RepID=UPI0022250798|nr:uncharacterized protein F5J12DRAFT_780725 [Pisolithus orientalis]KAI6025986.1 hypothetical protein F5J12DRAFT_780725 [Pisolithus orientalis]
MSTTYTNVPSLQGGYWGWFMLLTHLSMQNGTCHTSHPSCLITVPKLIQTRGHKPPLEVEDICAWGTANGGCMPFMWVCNDISRLFRIEGRGTLADICQDVTSDGDEMLKAAEMLPDRLGSKTYPTCQFCSQQSITRLHNINCQLFATIVTIIVIHDTVPPHTNTFAALLQYELQKLPWESKRCSYGGSFYASAHEYSPPVQQSTIDAVDSVTGHLFVLTITDDGPDPGTTVNKLWHSCTDFQAMGPSSSMISNTPKAIPLGDLTSSLSRLTLHSPGPSVASPPKDALEREWLSPDLPITSTTPTWLLLDSSDLGSLDVQHELVILHKAIDQVTRSMELVATCKKALSALLDEVQSQANEWVPTPLPQDPVEIDTGKHYSPPMK